MNKTTAWILSASLSSMLLILGNHGIVGNRARSATIPAFTIDTIAGRSSLLDVGDGGPAADAWLYNPTSIAFDASGNLYISDTFHHRIRKVDFSGSVPVISTVVGTGVPGFGGDTGLAANAMLGSGSVSIQ